MLSEPESLLKVPGTVWQATVYRYRLEAIPTISYPLLISYQPRPKWDYLPVLGPDRPPFGSEAAQPITNESPIAVPVVTV